MEKIQSMSFCYIFLGKTYGSSNKMKKFSDLLKSKSSILENLDVISITSGSLGTAYRIKISEIIDKIFLQEKFQTNRN